MDSRYLEVEEPTEEGNKPFLAELGGITHSLARPQM
jgi:hypothetical protein